MMTGGEITALVILVFFFGYVIGYITTESRSPPTRPTQVRTVTVIRKAGELIDPLSFIHNPSKEVSENAETKASDQ